MIYKALIRPFLFQFSPEFAHRFAIASATIAIPILNRITRLESDSFAVTVAGIPFKNPIGLAVGFDKNAEYIALADALGFGFTEIGSVSANPWGGNLKPRLFRLSKDHALINRMGLGNEGVDVIVERLKKQRSIPVGVNIVKTPDPTILGDAGIGDILTTLKKVSKYSDYITFNISCPNTDDGKTFEEPSLLNELCSAIKNEKLVPHFVKLSPDLSENLLRAVVSICLESGVDGFVIGNTSLNREGLKTSERVLDRIGRGGLSGSPIRGRSTQMVKRVSEITEGKVPIIGVGGIDSADAAKEKIKAGASLVQLYTGLIYEGPGLVKRIKQGLM